MLAWVCWDEFVNLESPYKVRWFEKCNETHIAALRIMMRDTLSHAVASREYNISPGSPEAGQLMSALLMAAMSKLAAMRTSVPVVLDKAEDTATRLMRGLFGNLLTIAGSGVQPMSLVWQLFGLNSNYDIPKTDVDWVWYETVVALYPYTSWPLRQFHENLEKFLDKLIVRVITKNENMAEVKQSRTAELVRYCKLRNIQLDHSRTIITILMRMLTTENSDIAAVAARLLEQLPHKLEKESQSYPKMIKYLEHLAAEGQRRVNDDLAAATVYTKRSAIFATLKASVSKACSNNDWPGMKEACQALLDKRAEITVLWKLKPESLKVQNLKLYKDLLLADFGDEVEDETRTKNLELTRQVMGDAEKWRVPWQVGKLGQFGDNIEPIDETLLAEILTGEKPEGAVATAVDNTPTEVTTTIAQLALEHDFAKFESSVQASFITAMQTNLTEEDVCNIMKVPVSTMRVFIKALNPELVWDNLGKNFKGVVVGLLENRSNRAESRPIRKLLELDAKKQLLQIEGEAKQGVLDITEA